MSRSTGRTTRIIDNCVQEFFKNGYTVVIDHHGRRESNENTMFKVVRRIKLEHGIDDMIVDLSNFKITKK